MAARALQSVTLSFGLVSIPAQVYSATNPSAKISFNMLHKCGSRVKQEYRCVAEDVIVPRDEMIKGYEFEKDKFVTFTKDELKSLEESSSELVTIDQFVAQSKIDPIYYESTYYLAPAKHGVKPYGLLLEAMRRSKKVAVGRWAARGKQYLVALRAGEDGLIMQQLLYSTEVRSQKILEIPTVEVKQQELDLAAQLIDSISVDEWHPEQFKDDVAERIMEQIQRKIAGQQIVAPQAPVSDTGAQVIDLMEALRASLRQPGAAKRSPARAANAESAPLEQAKAAPAAKRPAVARKAARRAA